MQRTDKTVKSLQDDANNRQKKEYTEWINSILQKEQMKVEDLFLDLSDGQKLMKLLEVVSGEKFSRLVRGKSKLHKVDNVNRCLSFLRTKVHIPSIGAEDIVDGNPRLILGLVWTIMHGFCTKFENDQDILLTLPLQDAQTTRLNELIKLVHQESLKPQPPTSAATMTPEKANVPEDNKVILQHTTCVLQVKGDAVRRKGDNEFLQNAVSTFPVKREDFRVQEKNNPLWKSTSGLPVRHVRNIVQNYDAIKHSPREHSEHLETQKHQPYSVKNQKNIHQAYKSSWEEISRSKHQQLQNVEEQKIETSEKFQTEPQEQPQKSLENDEEANVTCKVQLLQKKQREGEEVESIYQAHLQKTKQQEQERDEKPDGVYQLDIGQEKTEKYENSNMPQQIEKNNQADELYIEQKEKVEMHKALNNQYQQEEADEMNVVKNKELQQKEVAQDQDYSIEESEVEQFYKDKVDYLNELHISEQEQEQHDQHGVSELEQFGKEAQADDPHTLRFSEKYLKQDDKRNTEMELHEIVYLRNTEIEHHHKKQSDDAHKLHFSEEEQKLDDCNTEYRDELETPQNQKEGSHDLLKINERKDDLNYQSNTELKHNDRYESDDLLKLYFSEVQKGDGKSNTELELGQNQKVESKDLPKMHDLKLEVDFQSNTEAEHDDKEESDGHKPHFSIQEKKIDNDTESEFKQKSFEVHNEKPRIQNLESIKLNQEDKYTEENTLGNAQRENLEDSLSDSEYIMEGDNNYPTEFLLELRKKCKLLRLAAEKRRQEELELERQREEEQKDQEKQCEQECQDQSLKELKQEETRQHSEDESHKKEKIWREREAKRLQEEANRHREEVERQDQLKWEREIEELEEQLLRADGQEHRADIVRQQELIRQKLQRRHSLLQK